MRRVWALIARLLGGQLAVVLGTGVVFGLFALCGLANGIYDDYLVRAAADLAVGIVATVFVLVYARYLGGVRPAEFLLSWSRRDAIAVVCGALVVVGGAAAYIAVLGLSGVREVSVAAPGLVVLLVGLIGELGVVQEEVLSRGYFLRVLLRHVGPAPAIGISAVLFSAGHAIFKHPDFMLVGHVFAGIVLGYAYLKSGTLLVPILLHTAHNLAADLFLQGDDQGVSPGMGVFHFTGHLGAGLRLPFDAVLAVLQLLVLYLVYSRRSPVLAPHPRLVSDDRAAQGARRSESAGTR